MKSLKIKDSSKAMMMIKLVSKTNHSPSIIVPYSRYGDVYNTLSIKDFFTKCNNSSQDSIRNYSTLSTTTLRINLQPTEFNQSWTRQDYLNNTTRRRKFSPSCDYLERLQHLRFGNINIKTQWTTIENTQINAPLVDRYESILETIETIYNPDLEEKPKLTLISTSKGMGKSTFLCFCIKQFLSNHYLMEKFIFGDNLYTHENNIEIPTRLSKSENAEHYKRADFVNKLNIAYSIGHFIPFECENDSDGESAPIPIEQLFLRMVEEHMKRLFVGVEIILEKDVYPVFISCFDQLLEKIDSHPMKIHKIFPDLLLRFSELIQLNAPKVQDLINIPTNLKMMNDEILHRLPLIFLIDSFHSLNKDTGNNGSLYKLGIEWFNLRMTMKSYKLSPAAIVAANSLPNQFTSRDSTFFQLKIVNLDLLLGAFTFNCLTYELFNAFLHSSVLNEFGERKFNPPVKQQLSPGLSRMIVSILLLCSGNGRVIEKVYESCGLEITKMVECELSNNERTFNYKEMFEKAKGIVSEFSNSYTDSISVNIYSQYINLIKIMGVVMKPDTILMDNLTIEDLQKIGWFVKTHVDNTGQVASYVGSFMLLNAFTENPVPELQNIDKTQITDEFTNVSITYNDLLSPFKNLEQFKGDHFEQTIAGSIWARYCIACLESNISIGSPIPIGKVLPKKMIPPDCVSGMISLNGVVKLNKEFNSDTSIDKLPLDRVIINMNMSKFSNVILPIRVEGKSRFIGIQTSYIKRVRMECQPSRFVSVMKEVLDHPSGAFSFLFLSTHDSLGDLSKSRNNLKVKKSIEDNRSKFKISEPTNHVSMWWNLLIRK